VDALHTTCVSANWSSAHKASAFSLSARNDMVIEDVTCSHLALRIAGYA